MAARDPDDAQAAFRRGVILHQRGDLAGAIDAYTAAVGHRPRYAEALNNLGAALRDLGRLDQAIVAWRRALEAGPEHAKSAYNLGLALQDAGRLDEAAAALHRALALRPGYAKALYSLANQGAMAGGSGAADEAFALLERRMEALDQGSAEDQDLLLFAMGKALEGRGRFDAAFDCFDRAQRRRRAGGAFDIAAVENATAGIAEAFDAETCARLEGSGAASARPIFIVGMARSGTTLVEQILGAHPRVQAGGELPALPMLVANARGRDDGAYPSWVKDLAPEDGEALGQGYLAQLPAASGDDRNHLTDKTVSNFQHLGLIQLCLPEATIIHCRRDPRDACLSCYASRFSDDQAYAHDLSDLGRYWRAYDRLMAHWRAVLPPGRMLDVPYEGLVEDVETWARRLTAHCGLQWDDACLRFHETGNAVRTGSFAQVRRPVYAQSVGRWRRFERHLGPLLDALGESWSADPPCP